jgi:hypothetical protein
MLTTFAFNSLIKLILEVSPFAKAIFRGFIDKTTLAPIFTSCNSKLIIQNF